LHGLFTKNHGGSNRRCIICLAGAGTLPEPVLMPQEHVFAASGETVSETKYYQEKETQMSDPVLWWEWYSTIDYVIVTETYWDDTVGDTVSNSCGSAE
jgi:hypothetical protein